jgi:hypothetical protein
VTAIPDCHRFKNSTGSSPENLKLNAYDSANSRRRWRACEKMPMSYNTGNPSGSTSPKDLIDNAEDLDQLMTGDAVSVPNRLGVPLKSWKGMEGEHDADQTRREGEFDVSQAERVVEFNEFLDSSGYEVPVDYAPGLSINRRGEVDFQRGKCAATADGKPRVRRSNVRMATQAVIRQNG